MWTGLSSYSGPLCELTTCWHAMLFPRRRWASNWVRNCGELVALQHATDVLVKNLLKNLPQLWFGLACAAHNTGLYKTIDIIPQMRVF